MSATHPRLNTVVTAERPGPDRPTEDRIFTTDNAVIVLDGASQPEPGDRDGGWLADTLGREIRERLTDGDADLAEVVAAAIDSVAEAYALTPGESPSTTVTVLRWTDEYVDALVLGDSPVIAMMSDGSIHEVRDERLHRVAVDQRARLHSPDQNPADQRRHWQELVATERQRRNTPDGYWIAEALPEAARHAIRARWRSDELSTVAAMTDGVSAGVDRYRTPPDWQSALSLAVTEPELLVGLVHDTERSDPECERWPRSKRHDDKAIAVVRFDAT